MFPAWRQAFGTQEETRNVQRVWAEALIGCGLTDWRHIQRGLNKAKQDVGVFFPSVGQFISWCVPVNPRLAFRCWAANDEKEKSEMREKYLSQYGVCYDGDGYRFGPSPTEEAIKIALNDSCTRFKTEIGYKVPVSLPSSHG